MRKFGLYLIILVVLASFFMGAKLPGLSRAERSLMASRFHFSQFSLPVTPPVYRSGDEYSAEVNPKLKHIGSWVSLIGASVSMIDYDRDGLPNDLCITDLRSKTVLLSPAPRTGMRFKPIELLKPGRDFDGQGIYPSGCKSGDFNRDGLIDFAVIFLGRQPLLLLQDSLDERGFTRVEMVSDSMPEWYSATGNVADYDGDGYLDLAVGNYWREGNETYKTTSTHEPVLQNSLSKADNGGLNYILRQVVGSHPTRFEVVQPFDSLDSRSYTLAMASGDLTGDALPEIYYSNDFGPDLLYKNQSVPGKIALVKVKGRRNPMTPKSKTLGWDSFKGMGADFADLDGDGLLDIYVSNIAGDWKVQESHFLWHNTNHPEAWLKNEAPYTEISEKLGLSRSDWGWDSKLADLDNDGILEAFQATGGFKGKHNAWPELQQWAMGLDGFIADPSKWPKFMGNDVSGNSHNRFFVADKHGYYHDLANEIGLGGAYCSRGISLGDVDGDGDLDIAVANIWEDSYFYLNESQNENGFLGAHILKCADQNPDKPFLIAGHPQKGSKCAPDIGVRVRVVQDNIPGRIILIDGNNGHSGGRAADALFGFGKISQLHTYGLALEWRDQTGFHTATLPAALGWNTIIMPKGDKHGFVSL
jgi:enediyne biosynthesis protein E4